MNLSNPVSAADSDVVWDRFLPSEYSSSSSSSSTTWSALWKKELYFRTRYNLIHKGKMSFWFDLPSRKKCYMISARELYIEDADSIIDWRWFSIPDANAKYHLGIPDCRFSEVVVCVDLCHFEIGGKITTSLLSSMTTYITYLVYFVFSQNCVWFEDEDEEDNPVEVFYWTCWSNNGQYRTIYFHRERQDGNDDGFYPKKRADGWMESELGEFFNRGDEDDELLMTIETGIKENIVVQGIEIRPKKE
ncbi:hypothetical protein EZV62_009940 [Acer yangbiense]|uniref:Uncharacterized protein n=1 Tax=Acer yangbiense TaxID=1000413 RepID=A0A5C7I2Z4_9ROSI|nr:hypothetical protein EZV62_009940 [Acer yangbiense]